MNLYTSAYLESFLKTQTGPDIYAPSDYYPASSEAYPASWRNPPKVETKHFALNGEASLPEGYFWTKPEITQLNTLASYTLKREGILVGRSKNMVKGLASVVQLIFSSITLYRARGSQLERYGYAAFGLSVFPYTLMSFINLVVVTIVGEYSTLFVLRTAISDEAKRCGGTISGEIGTLPEESPVEGCSLNGIEISNDGEDRHVTPLLKVDDSNPELQKCDGNLLREANKATTTGAPPEAKDVGSTGTCGEGTDGFGVPMPENPAVFLSGKPLVAANLRVDNDGVLVITMKGRTGRFKLTEGVDDDSFTFHFYVSAVTNQEKVSKREKPLTKIPQKKIRIVDGILELDLELDPDTTIVV